MSAGGQGKRGASGPIASASDEEEQDPQSPVSTNTEPPAISPTLLDHDYENVSSPGNSSTASGPTYARQPGFTIHAHEITVSKVKKKKSAIISVKEGVRRREPTPPKSKPKRDPLPMRMRALPQSFWQQPNIPHNVSPANAYPVLPPLYTREGEAVPDERPVTPPGDEDPAKELVPTPPAPPPQPPPPPPSTTSSHKPHATHVRIGERKITIANTDLLFKLFEGVEKAKSSPFPQLKRSRPRKFVPCSSKTFLSGEDPYLMECVTDKMFPHLSLEQSGGRAGVSGGGAPTSTLQLVTLREGDKSITLPSLSIEQNYPQMLSELVMNI